MRTYMLVLSLLGVCAVGGVYMFVSFDDHVAKEVQRQQQANERYFHYIDEPEPKHAGFAAR